MNETAIFKYLSLSAAQRRIACGTDAVLDEVRRPGKKCVLLASDASTRTTKQVTDKCTYYNVPLVKLDTPMDSLGKQIGKGPTAAVAVTLPNIVKEILKYAESN